MGDHIAHLNGEDEINGKLSLNTDSGYSSEEGEASVHLGTGGRGRSARQNPGSESTIRSGRDTQAGGISVSEQPRHRSFNSQSQRGSIISFTDDLSSRLNEVIALDHDYDDRPSNRHPHSSRRGSRHPGAGGSLPQSRSHSRSRTLSLSTSHHHPLYVNTTGLTTAAISTSVPSYSNIPSHPPPQHHSTREREDMASSSQLRNRRSSSISRNDGPTSPTTGALPFSSSRQRSGSNLVNLRRESEEEAFSIGEPLETSGSGAVAGNGNIGSPAGTTRSRGNSMSTRNRPRKKSSLKPFGAVGQQIYENDPLYTNPLPTSHSNPSFQSNFTAEPVSMTNGTVHTHQRRGSLLRNSFDADVDEDDRDHAVASGYSSSIHSPQTGSRRSSFLNQFQQQDLHPTHPRRSSLAKEISNNPSSQQPSSSNTPSGRRRNSQTQNGPTLTRQYSRTNLTHSRTNLHFGQPPSPGSGPSGSGNGGRSAMHSPGQQPQRSRGKRSASLFTEEGGESPGFTGERNSFPWSERRRYSTSEGVAGSGSRVGSGGAGSPAGGISVNGQGERYRTGHEAVQASKRYSKSRHNQYSSRKGEDYDALDQDDDDGWTYGDAQAREAFAAGIPTSTSFKLSRGRERAKPSSMAIPRMGRTTRRKIFIWLLVILGLFLLGTVIVLSSVQQYLSIADWAYLTELELGGWDEKTAGRIKEFQKEGMQIAGGAEHETGFNDRPGVMDGHGVEWVAEGKGSGAYWMRKNWDGRVKGSDEWDRLYNITALPGETIPRIIHQTWKADTLPEKWRDVWRECREGMPDYEYMLWTDDLSRQFIADKYPSFLATFDGYEYPIQRADAIRYFILHQFGGVYMDLDIGCRRRFDPLLQGDWQVILPRTKPVGVSNDLIFSSRRSPFMEATIHGLIAFNHKYVSNYPTVMFSTGPMFLSAQYGLYTSAHPLTPKNPRPAVRILPKPLYGKNAKPGEAPHAFFSHFYGSSWHADDADFIVFLGRSGKLLMYAGMGVFVIGAFRFFLGNNRTVRSGRRGLRRFVMSTTGGGQYHMVSILPTTDSRDASRAPSPSATEFDSDDSDTEGFVEIMKRAGSMLLPQVSPRRSGANKNSTGGNAIFFMPELFTAAETGARRSRSGSASKVTNPGRASTSTRQAGPSRAYHEEYIRDLRQDVVSERSEEEESRRASTSSATLTRPSVDESRPPTPLPPPPYEPYNVVEKTTSRD